jgi:hypothetical protein
MCAGCRDPLPVTGTRYMLTIRTATGGDEVAFCTAACRLRWTASSTRVTPRQKAA